MTQEVPLHLQKAMQAGELSTEQLIELITLEASWLNLTFNEAFNLKCNDLLPHSVLGSDIDFLMDMLNPPND